MAIVNPFMTGSNITNPNLKNFLHQRARQWKVASGATDPRECIEVPHHYAQDDLEILDSSKEGPINWLENISPLSANIDISKNSSCFKASNENASAEGLDERYDMDPICATFAGGSDNPTGAGECVFTNRAVQHCILEFFEEVAHKPNGFRNPTFIAARSDPTGWGEEGDAAYQPLRLVEISPERTELEEKRKHLANMREALLFIPNYDPDLYMGRNNLQKRISELEEDVFRLQKKAHLGGGLKSGEVKDMTDHWSPEKQGPLISFAGVLVDSELVKGAGLEETVEEELMKLGGSN
jgi:hypothetical protein